MLSIEHCISPDNFSTKTKKHAIRPAQVPSSQYKYPVQKPREAPAPTDPSPGSRPKFPAQSPRGGSATKDPSPVSQPKFPAQTPRGGVTAQTTSEVTRMHSNEGVKK